MSNHTLDAPDHPGLEADFYFPTHHLIVETDGWDTHQTKHAFEDDRAKDAALTAAGYTVMRFTWRQLRDDPHTVADRLEAIMRRVHGAAAASARRTCSSVTTPRRRSSRSMTISAPSERRPSEPSSCSIGVSSWTLKASSPSASTTSETASAGLPLLHGAVDAVLVQQPEEAPRDRVGDREPRPAVAQEELVLGLRARWCRPAPRPAGCP